jgi:hypothetical protein
MINNGYIEKSTNSPADEFAVDEVPLESLHVEDVQV